jgi:WD40 repeat protein
MIARILTLTLIWLPAAAGFARAADDRVSFARQIQPILAARCIGCHQSTLASGGMIVTTYADFRKGGRHGVPFVPEKPADSLVVKHLTGAVEPRMPMGMDPLPETSIELFRRWIAEGAADDSGAADADPIPTEAPSYSASPVITALAFSPDGTMLAVSGNHEILVHRADGSELMARLVGRSERIHSVQFSPDGKLLAAVGGSPARFGEAQLWDVASRRLLGAVKVGSDTLFGVSFSPDGKYLAFGCPDKTIRLFEVPAFKEIRKMENHQDWVFATEFSVDGKRLVSVSRDHFLKMSEVATGAFLENLNLLTKATFGGQGELYALARHPTKDVVVAAGDDRTPRMYTMHRPRAIRIDDDSCLLRELEPQPGAVQAVRFSPDGAFIAVAGMGESVNVYASDTGAKVATVGGHKGGIYSLAFGPGGRLVAAGFDGVVRIYDVKRQALEKSFVPVPVGTSAPRTASRLQ